MSNAQHSAKDNRWFTPKYIIDPALEVLGPVDLDPASEAEANNRIGAARYYTEQTDGLSMDWTGTIWLNPPGGKRDNKPLPQLFWKKLMTTKQCGWLQHAIYLAYSLEQLQSFQRKDFASPCRFLMCIPDKRIRYELWDGTKGSSPTHASAIIYVSGRVNLSGVFAEEFSKLGDIVVPWLG